MNGIRRCADLKMKPKDSVSFLRDPSKIKEDVYLGMRRVIIEVGAYYTCYNEHKEEKFLED